MKHFMDDSQCENCNVGHLRRRPDEFATYKIDDEVAEWLAPLWICDKCGCSFRGEHDNDDQANAIQKAYARALAKSKRHLNESLLNVLLQMPSLDIRKGPTGMPVESLHGFPVGSEQHTMAGCVSAACSYISELPALIRKNDYSEILHHVGHVHRELEEITNLIRVKREKGVR